MEFVHTENHLGCWNWGTYNMKPEGTCICPACGAILKAQDYGKEQFPKAVFTFYCVFCLELLLMADMKVSDFHKTIHAEYSDWPADGKETHSLVIQ